MAKAKHCYMGSTEHLINMTVRDLQWAEKCQRSGQRLVMLATAEPASHSEVLPRLALLSEEFAGFLELQPAEVSQSAQTPFANFHADYLELALHQAPERIPLILSALHPRNLAALVLVDLESRAHDFSGSVTRRRFLATRVELRRLALGLLLLPGGRDDNLDIKAHSSNLPDDLEKLGNPTKSELVQEFLDIVFRIARKQEYSHRDPLQAYVKRNAVHITERKDFFPDLIRTLQQHIKFESAVDGTLGSDRVVKYGLDITGTMFLFIVEECWNLIYGITINPTMFAQIVRLRMNAMREMGAISDDDLRDFIISYSQYEQPWLLLAAISVAVKRNLCVKYIL